MQPTFNRSAGNAPAWLLLSLSWASCPWIHVLYTGSADVPPWLQITHSGLWAENSGYSVGEQAEQYFSHESSRAQTVKTMSLAQSVDTLTQSAEDWAEHKRQGQAKALAAR